MKKLVPTVYSSILNKVPRIVLRLTFIAILMFSVIGGSVLIADSMVNELGINYTLTYLTVVIAICAIISIVTVLLLKRS